MSRVSVTTWADGVYITRSMNKLSEALMKYQPYSRLDPDTGRPGVGCLGGDSDVIVEAIVLRDRLDALIKKSNDAIQRSTA